MSHRSGTYSVPSSLVFGIQQDAHVRRWHVEQKLRASDGITTESLLADLRKPFDPDFTYPVGRG